MAEFSEKDKAAMLAASERVQRVSQKALDLVMSETQDIEDGGTRWLILSRIFSTLYQHHFAASVKPESRVPKMPAPQPPGACL